MSATQARMVERELSDQYAAALEDYLAGAGEAALMRAYELGRRAVADGLGILKVAAVYNETLSALLLQLTADGEESVRVSRRAAAFFSESLSPFEMTFRGFEEAITSLRRLNETLEQRVMERTQELRRLERFNENIVATVPAGLLVLDKGGRVISANRSFISLTHLRPGDVVGKPVDSVLDLIGLSRPCRDAVSAGEAAVNLECQGRAPAADGAPANEELYVTISLTPMRPDGQAPPEDEQELLVIEDITARKRAEREIEAARQRLLQAEIDKKRFYREVILAVTNGRFHLVDAGDILAVGRPVLDISLEGPEGYATVRRELQKTAEDAGMSPDAAGDLVLAAGEAITNAIKHAYGGRCTIYLAPERLAVRVTDEGTGIRPDALPGAILRPGFSTAVSLGMGYTLMLTLTDDVWLATGPEGTVVQLEKRIHPDESRPASAPIAWDRL